MSSPATVTIEVVSTEMQIMDLEDAVADLVGAGTLGDGNGNAPLSKLASALAVLAGGDCEGARNKIQAFINQVNALLGSGRLTAEQAADLIDAAGAVLADSDC
jgi:hypothetical protein